jgi:hypothetical protein
VELEKFRRIVEDHLIPLFSGATLEEQFGESNSNRAAVRWRDIQSIEIKPQAQSDYCLVVRRNQPFAKTSSPFITEYRVIQAFVTVLNEIGGSLGQPYESDILATFARRVVAKSLCDCPAAEATLLAAIDHLDGLATRLYEGHPISAALGFESVQQVDGLLFSRLWDQDYCIVPTNGLDTMLVVNLSGEVVRYEALNVPAQPPDYVPHRLSPIAAWAQAQQGRIAVILNRMGEILVIRDGQLAYARRNGRWYFLTHEPVITQMRGCKSQAVRRAVYASCLDASFARTGACVGIMSSGDVYRLRDIVPKDEDHLGNPQSEKASFLRKVIGNQSFHNLDRRLRLELLTVDGATVVSYKGEILAVGAILQIPGGSSGGGRLAAAIALSKYGTGIKVSQDGSIRGYYRSGDPATAKPAFFIM